MLSSTIVAQLYIHSFSIPFEFVDVPYTILQTSLVGKRQMIQFFLTFNKYYFFYFAVPCFLISCITILGFLLAPDSGEKLTLRK